MAEVNKIFQIAYVAKKRDGSRAVNKTDRTVEGWASKPLIDRDNELIEWNAWELDNFNKNPVFMPFHDYSKNPVGKVLWTKTTEEGLLFKAQFAKKGTSALADEMFDLYEQGIMNAFSVGFRPMKWVDAKSEGDPKRRYTQAELLEISGVGLPSLTDALVAEYEAGNIETRELQDQIYADAITKGMIVEPKELVEGDEPEDAITGTEDLLNAVDLAVAKGLIPADSPGLSLMRQEMTGDVEEKEGRRFSKKTLKALDDVRSAAKASNEANHAIIEALDVLVDLPEDGADEIDDDIETREIDIEEMTSEMAAYLLEQDEKEKQDAVDAKKLTAAEEVLVRLGHQL